MLNVAATWRGHAPPRDGIFGARLLLDGGRVVAPDLAIARAILHTNLQIAPADALDFAVQTVRAARDNGLPPEFLGAALLQESAYDPRAFSSAGAVGIGQFMSDTAAGIGLDPNDPDAAIAGAAELLGDYVRAYRDRGDRYSLALAAYDAGPGAVAQYGGVPPYAETRGYIDDIDDREVQVYGYESGARRQGDGFFGE
jgi:soluble lytic murein transglycosylase-like protein